MTVPVLSPARGNCATVTIVDRTHLALLLLVACEGRTSDPFLDVGSGSATTSAHVKEPSREPTGSAAPQEPAEGTGVTTEWKADWKVDGVSKSTPIVGNPTLTVIERAFRNQQPAWPLLSKDGQTAVVALPTRTAPDGWLTFSVAYLAPNQAEAADLVPLIDRPLMTTIHTKLDTAAIAMPRVKQLVKAARRINDRVAEGGFTPFGGRLDKLPASGRAGSFKLQLAEGEAIEVTLGDWTTTTPRLEAQRMPEVGEVECVAQPALRRVLFDDPRKRVLVHYGWEAPATCALPDDRYFLVGP